MDTVALIAGCFVTGLAGSLHCVGMCGPILVAFAPALERHPAGARRLAGSPYALYHAGRIWTYGVFGFFAGLLGQQLRHGAAWVGWQRGLSLFVAGTVIAGGVWLLGPWRGRLPSRWRPGCATFGRWPWFRALLDARSSLSRLLLGSVMGLLPCGLVYAMLPVVAALPHPLWSAAGMVAFGIGTVPALSAVIFVGRAWPARLRRHGVRIVAVALILAGAFMAARAMLVTERCHEGAGREKVAYSSGDEIDP